MIRIVIADAHALMREGLRLILGEVPTIKVLSEASNGFEVLAQARAGGFEVLLLDLSVQGRSGIELIRQLKSEAPAIRVLVLTMQDEEHYGVPAIRAGAHGFLNKRANVEELVSAVHRVASGRPHVSRTMAEQLAQHVASFDTRLPHAALSEREYEVFTHLVLGHSVTQTALEMAVSVKTISTHKARMMEKMGMSTIAEIVQYAVERHLVPVAP